MVVRYGKYSIHLKQRAVSDFRAQSPGSRTFLSLYTAIYSWPHGLPDVLTVL